MAISNEWTEWHLTAGGWIRGSQRRDPAQFQQRAVPDERVLTVIYKETMGRPGPVHSSHEPTWESDDKTVIERLVTRFGPPPDEL
jgi:hypothetical protein